MTSLGSDDYQYKGEYKMKKSSTNGMIVCASLLLAGITSTLNANATHPTFTAPNQINQEISYTASGKTDRKTAVLFQQLMRNNKNMQIHAEVAKRPVPQRDRQLEVAVNYTVHGKTDMKTLRKLIELFQNNKEVYVSATANVKTTKNTIKRTSGLKESKPQKKPNLYNNSKTAYAYIDYPPVYYPVMKQAITPQIAPQYPQLSADNAPFPMDYSPKYSKRIAAR